MRRRLFLFLLGAGLWLGSGSAATAQPRTGLLFRDVTVGGKTYRYEVYVPPSWTSKRKWPVILFLHGAGHRGQYAPNETESLLGKRFTAYQQQSAAIVVFPDRKSTRLNSSHIQKSRMPSSA